MSETIQCIDHDGWFEITLNRPDRLNSFNEEMHLALRGLFEQSATGICTGGFVDGCGTWVLRGSGFGGSRSV